MDALMKISKVVTDGLRRLDFSISEIKEIIQGGSIDSLCRVLKKQLSRMDKTRTDLDARREAITEPICMLEARSSFTLLSLENMLLPLALERKNMLLQNYKEGYQWKMLKRSMRKLKMRIHPFFLFCLSV